MYTYLIKNKTTQLAYYGVRFSKKARPEDLWNTYFTSSKLVKDLIKQFGKADFEFEVRKVFDDPKKAVNWENRVLRRLAVKSPKFLNIDSNQEPDKPLQNKCKTRMISNSILGICRRVPADLPLLDGWRYGNVNASNINVSKRRWFYEPSTLKLHHCYPEDVDPVWIPGRPGPSNSAVIRGRITINNGSTYTFISKTDIIPEGWTLGVGTARQKPSGKRIHQWKWICSETETFQIKVDDPLPEGFIPGKVFNSEGKGDCLYPYLIYVKRLKARIGYLKRKMNRVCINTL